MRWRTGVSPKIAAKEHEVPTKMFRNREGVVVFLVHTSVDKVVAALIAQIFTASDRSGSRQSKNNDIDSSSGRKRNTATSASA